MRAMLDAMAAACCVLGVTICAAHAHQQTSTSDTQCRDKPNLTNIVVTMSRLDYMAGTEPGSVQDDVLMIDFSVSVENTGGIGAERSRLRHTAQVRSLAGAVVESAEGTMDIYGLGAGETETSLVTLMVSRLGDLVQPSGEIEASIRFRAAIDIDGEIDECVETDNSAEAITPLKTEKVVG